VDSAHVLIEQIAPQVWQSLPETRFVIAGRMPTPAVMALAGERVSVLANVPSVMDVFHSADVAVFPDTHGVGIRNSVSEALSAGVPVVATPAAAREQSEHQLLSVLESVPDLVERIVEVLALVSQRIPIVPEAVSPERSWAEAVAEYLEELRVAVSPSTGSIGGEHPA
jgi:glycosyltransferase involved in cell wall biosynthesis